MNTYGNPYAPSPGDDIDAPPSQNLRLSRFTTRAEAAEINRRLKAAGYRSTAELCYNYTLFILDYFAGQDVLAWREVHKILRDVLD